MKKLFTAALMLTCCICTGQGLVIQPRKIYPKCDTVPCLFLEVQNMKTADTDWKAGFVIRHDGFIEFEEKVNVDEFYLPITSGIVKSPLLYANGDKVTKPVIHIILVQKETISNTEQFLNQ